jgi:hypothetical protein
MPVATNAACCDDFESCAFYRLSCMPRDSGRTRSVAEKCSRVRVRPAPPFRQDERGAMMQLGPLEFLVIGFPGNQFTGAITEELHHITEQGIIRIIDLVFMMKDDAGNLTTVELSDREEVEFGLLHWGADDHAGVLTSEDVASIADIVPNGSSAALVLFEHRWALGLREAVMNAGGVLLAQDRVSPEALAVLGAELDREESEMAGASA